MPTAAPQRVLRQHERLACRGLKKHTAKAPHVNGRCQGSEQCLFLSVADSPQFRWAVQFGNIRAESWGGPRRALRSWLSHAKVTQL